MKKTLLCLICISLSFNFVLKAQNNDSILQKAIKLIDSEQYYDAERCLKSAIDNGADSLYLHYELAWCYYSMQTNGTKLGTGICKVFVGPLQTGLGGHGDDVEHSIGVSLVLCFQTFV